MDVKKLIMKPLQKIQKKITFLSKPKNVPKVLFLVGLLLILYLIYHFLLSKEGFESTPETLEDDIAPQKSMVLFHADWCGHCKKFMPTWDELSSKWNESQNEMKFIKVECGKSAENPEHAEIMKKYNIKGYPTILVFENGKSTEYNQGRDKSSIETFLKLDSL